MLTLLLLKNLHNAANSGAASVGAPPVSVGAPAPTTGSGGGGVRFFGASYNYDEPVVVAAKEEIKILREEKKELKRDDTAMLIAINDRLKYLRQLIKDRKALFLRAQENYEYQAKMAEQAATQRAEQEKVVKKRKRARRMKAIMRLLN